MEATKSTIDEDGWLHTGDISYFDQKGYMHIVDRAKEIIKYKGFQVKILGLYALAFFLQRLRVWEFIQILLPPYNNRLTKYL